MIIVTDSASDIRKEDIEKLNVHVVPLNISFGDEHYKDGVDLDIDTFYEFLKTKKDFPKTACPSPQDYLDIFLKAKEEDEEVLCICLSSGLSSTYQTACLAKDLAEYDKIHVVDSLTCLTGERLVVTNACKLRDEGKSITEIVEVLNDITHKVHIFSIVNSLEYFYKGGRISKALYTISSILNFKVFISLDKDGKIVKPGQTIGLAKAIGTCAKDFKKYPFDKKYGICYGYTTDKENLDKLINKSFGLTELESYDIAQIGPTSGSHIGEGGICYAYISQKEID